MSGLFVRLCRPALSYGLLVRTCGPNLRSERVVRTWRCKVKFICLNRPELRSDGRLIALKGRLKGRMKSRLKGRLNGRQSAHCEIGYI